MKKLFVFAGVLLLAFSPVAAQNADSVRFRRADGKPVTIETVDRDSLGIDTLRRIAGVDYSGYAPGEAGFLDQRLGPSFHFSFSVMQICLSLHRSRTLSLGLGLQYTLDNIRLADSGITLGNIGGRLVPVALDEPADKSKAVTSSLGIPVRLIYEPVKRLRITAVAYSDFMLGADAIYKKPKEKHSLSGFRAYQFGLGASVAYRGFGLYARYGITPLFKHDAGPDCHTVSFGFAYSLSL